jgi:hypothetical protein
MDRYARRKFRCISQEEKQKAKRRRAIYLVTAALLVCLVACTAGVGRTPDVISFAPPARGAKEMVDIRQSYLVDPKYRSFSDSETVRSVLWVEVDTSGNIYVSREDLNRVMGLGLPENLPDMISLEQLKSYRISWQLYLSITYPDHNGRVRVEVCGQWY